MKTNYLLPTGFKRIGWFIFVPGILLGMVYLIKQPDIDFLNVTVFSIAENDFFSREHDNFRFTKNNIFDEISGLLIIVGALFVAFSKEKSEDEFISKIRLDSLVWATYVNYTILIFTIIFLYDMAFFWVMIFNMFTLLIFFIIRYNWALYNFKKQIGDEE
jgi:hypothetical protein